MYVELKCKSNFSFLRGASDSREYVAQAQALGMCAVGITDINGVYALPRAYEAIRDHAPGVKLICGSQVTMEDHPPITLLAKTKKGYGLMCRILTRVHQDKEKGEGFLTFSDLLYLTDEYPGVQDLICLPDLAQATAQSTTQTTNLELLKEVFPKNLYLPLCRYLDGMDLPRTQLARDFSKLYELPIVATNDVHYHHFERRPLSDCMTCIREGTNLDHAGFKLFGNEERYLKSDLQMRALFHDLPDAISETERISDQCTFSLSELKYNYPAEFIPKGHTAKSYLYELVYEGARKTYKGLIPPKVDAQIRRELAFFAKRGDEHYFLTVHDIVRFAEEQGIFCQGRGSAANSVVCYVLGITSVDPVNMNLLFDRFMNDGRKEPPDIDIDFEHDRREEVIQYIYQRFGRERAAMVAAIRTYRSKSAFIELSKAVGLNVGTMSAGELNLKFDELAQDLKYRRPFVDQLLSTMKGFPRHLSIHSGGFVLSNDPLIEMVPIEPARMEARTIIQWDKEDIETLGLMKIDVLSIGFLTALHKSTDLAQMSWRDIPPDDPKTYAMIRRAETHGTFQIESRAQMAMLVQTLPNNYYDLVVEVALVRPSPTKGGMIQPYLKGRIQQLRGIPFTIGNEKLDHILGRTCGVPIFQEQIMQISIDVAGFTPAEADQLRRSLGKQRSAESVDAMGKKLYQALVSHGVPKKFADDLFNYIQGYAHYGFPESHAASYASLAYKSAYMKCHHPAELLIGLINSQPMGFYSVDTLINEAKRNRVEVLPVEPNLSVWDAQLEGPRRVRMGFRNIRKLREADVEILVIERERKRFQSIDDFISRTKFNREAIENLALANVFESFGLDRRHSFWQSIEFTNLCAKSEAPQLSLFDQNTTSKPFGQPQLAPFGQPQPPLFGEMSLLEKTLIDYRKMGYSLEGNLMRALRLECPHLPSMSSVAVRRLPRGRCVEFAGILTVLQRPPPAMGTAFITLEDEVGSVDLILKSETFEKYEPVIKSSRFLIIEGRVQRKGQGMSVLVSHLESFTQQSTKRPISPGQSPRSLGQLETGHLANVREVVPGKTD